MLNTSSSSYRSRLGRRLASWLPVIALALLPASAGALPVDPYFDPGFGTSERVNAVGAQVFGYEGTRKVVIGGAFTTVAGHSQFGLARFADDGSFDPGFLGHTDGTVWDLEVLSNNQIVVGGSFATINGVALPGLARLQPDGSLDTSFQARINGTVLAIHRQPADGKLVVGGVFSLANGQPVGNIARFLPNGALDTTFQTGYGAEGYVTSIERVSTTTLLVGGAFTSFNGQPRSRLVRLFSSGGIDSSFQGSADGVVQALATSNGGWAVVGGSFSQLSGHPQKNIGRLHPDGSYDDTWDGETDGKVEALDLSLTGRLLIGGSFSRFRGEPHANLVQLDAGDALEAEQAGTDGPVYGIYQERGSNFIAGLFRYAGGLERNAIASLAGRFRPDRGFDPPGTSSGSTFAIIHQPDGGFLIGGALGIDRGGGQTPIWNLARLRADGSVDASYLPQPDRDVEALFDLADGSVLAGGEFTTIGGTSRRYLAKILPNGAVDAAYQGQSPFPVTGFAAQGESKVLVLSSQTWPENLSRLTRLLPSGAADPLFRFPAQVAGLIDTIAVQPDGRILVGALTPVFIGQASRYVFRLLADGSFDPSFDADLQGDVYVVAPLPSGKILVGGRFYQVAGQPRMALVRLEASGALDPAFAPPLLQNPAYNKVVAITPMITGQLTVLGNLYASSPRNNFYDLCYLCQFQEDGSLDPLRTEDYQGHFYGHLVQADGATVLGNQPIATYGGDFHQYAGRIFPPEPPEQRLELAGGVLTWKRSGALPVLAGVRFEVSRDGGLTFSQLPAPLACDEGWCLGGLAYENPAGLRFRASGRHQTGFHNASSTLMRQSVTVADPNLPEM